MTRSMRAVAQEAFGKLLGLGTERSIAALLPVGVPDENPPARPRKPVDEMMRTVERKRVSKEETIRSQKRE